MSATSGTATDYLDLLNKLRTFLTTDSTLVSLGQNWTELKTNSTPYTRVEGSPAQTNTIVFETYLKAPGLSTTEQIYVQLQAYTNAGLGSFNWRLRGAIGFVSVNDWFTQPGASPDANIYLWNSSIPYWFIANGQRVIVAAQVSAEYEHLYLGKFLPDGTAGQYPMPMFIGGTGGVQNDGSSANRNHADVTAGHASFWDPTSAYILDLSGAWQMFSHWVNGNDTHSSSSINQIWPYGDDGTSGTPGATAGGGMKWMVQNLDGSYPLLPVRLEQKTPSINLLGTLDGVFATTGEGNSPGSSFTVGSDTYYTFQDTFRSARQNFVAYKFA